MLYACNYSPELMEILKEDHDFCEYIKIGAFGNTLAFIDEAQAKKLDNVTVEENDILLNITGASVARCCIAPKDYLPARVNQHVSIIRIKLIIYTSFN